MIDHPSTRFLITGATGQLGGLVLRALLERVPAGEIAVLVRNDDAAAKVAPLGVQVRRGDYTDPDRLDAAFAGVERALFVSSSTLEGRATQHRNVVEAAKRAGVRLLAYTSILHADGSPIALAADHRDTEAAIRASGVPFVFLRNGWYTENYLGGVPAALAHGAVVGSAREGRISAAARADYAAAAVAVLLATDDLSGRVFELAGDQAFTRAAFAAELARLSGQAIAYRDLPQADYAGVLRGAELPAALADLVADADASAANGALFDDGHALSTLIGRPTTPWSESLAQALAAS